MNQLADRISHTQLIVLVVIAVAGARLLEHPYNVTPIGAFALFCGAYFTDRRLWLLPLAALLIGDVVTGFYAAMVMVFVYGGFALSSLVGRYLPGQERSPIRTVGGVLLAALAFYLVSNVGMWLYAYPLTAAGLLACWIDGLPYLLRSVVGDLIYAGLMFGIVEWHGRVTSRNQDLQEGYAG